eukprot:PLAT12043.1.p1 GENE.PLAT12043.1~~PLAT12043.1.p1  ORF type:complete len:132 (+),score=66.86 PLAT12043.1:24-419(+)
MDHVVLFKWKSDASETQVSEAENQLMQMVDEIDVVQSVECGSTFTERGGGFQTALVVRLAEKDDLDTYRDHKHHRHIVESYIRPISDEVIALDFESERKESCTTKAKRGALPFLAGVALGAAVALFAGKKK